MAELDFTVTKKNIADQLGNFKPGPTVGLLFVPKDTQIATVATAMLEATYTTGLNLALANRWQIINFDKGVRLFQVTPTQDEPKFEESDFSGIRSKVAAGNKRTAMVFSHLAPYTLKALQGLENQDLDMFEITENNYILGKTPDGTKLEGFSVNYFCGNQMPGENSGASSKLTIYIDYKDADEWDKNGILALPTAFSFSDVDGIVDVEITEVSSGTSAIVVDVKSHIGAVAISGLVTADFKASIVSTGANVAISGATESTTVAGRYTLAGTFTEVPHYIKTTDQPDATTKGYETPDDYRLTTTPS